MIRPVKCALFVLCCAADLFVLRPVWFEREIPSGQFRRGYFELLDERIGIALDNAIRPSLIPTYVATDDGNLAVPPGMVAVVPLADGEQVELVVDSTWAPYAAIGEEAPLQPLPQAGVESASGEAQLAHPRVLSLQGGRLTLVDWDLGRPWRDDRARLPALRDACAAGETTPRLVLSRNAEQLEMRFGSCASAETLASSDSTILLAAIAGPGWIVVERRPGWQQSYRVLWPVVAAVLLKVSALWWGAGVASAVATSAVLAGAATLIPVAAILTWPLLLIAGIAASFVRGLVRILRPLTRRQRIAAALAGTAAAGAVAMWLVSGEPTELGPSWTRTPENPETCAVIGYSTAEDEGLRQEHGGLRWILNGHCAPCQDRTPPSFAFGGATLAWLGDAFCSTRSSFGRDGHVFFIGGANDDFLTGVTGLARMFVVGRQGPAAWSRNQASAAAASLAKIGEQTAMLANLVRCSRSRGADFLLLHDFLVTDLVDGRTRDRAAMLSARRDAVLAEGGKFVDLLDAFEDEAGVSWFNDFVHFSVLGHGRIADRACREIHGGDAAVRKNGAGFGSTVAHQ
jgi:hypothetical protein